MEGSSGLSELKGAKLNLQVLRAGKVVKFEGGAVGAGRGNGEMSCLWALAERGGAGGRHQDWKGGEYSQGVCWGTVGEGSVTHTGLEDGRASRRPTRGWGLRRGCEAGGWAIRAGRGTG